MDPAPFGGSEPLKSLTPMRWIAERSLCKFSKVRALTWIELQCPLLKPRE
jgi:hypothetical protein